MQFAGERSFPPRCAVCSSGLARPGCCGSEGYLFLLRTKAACVSLRRGECNWWQSRYWLFLFHFEPFPFPGGLWLEQPSYHIRTRTFLCLLAFASGCIGLSVWIAMDIPLWNVGFYLVDLISKTSGFCCEWLLPPQNRTGSFFSRARSWGFEFAGCKDFKVTFKWV